MADPPVLGAESFGPSLRTGSFFLSQGEGREAREALLCQGEDMLAIPKGAGPVGERPFLT